MDWMRTNGSEIFKWSERPKMEDYTYTLKETPLELMIDLCNRQKINPWFCMPHRADDDFVRNFAEMVRDRLVRVIAWQAANAWWTDHVVLPFEDVAKNCD